MNGVFLPLVLFNNWRNLLPLALLVCRGWESIKNKNVSPKNQNKLLRFPLNEMSLSIYGLVIYESSCCRRPPWSLFFISPRETCFYSSAGVLLRGRRGPADVCTKITWTQVSKHSVPGCPYYWGGLLNRSWCKILHLFSIYNIVCSQVFQYRDPIVYIIPTSK